MLAPEDFEDKAGELGTRLVPAALRRYLGIYETTMREGEPSPRARIQEQVNALRRAVMSGDAARGASGEAASAD